MALEDDFPVTKLALLDLELNQILVGISSMPHNSQYEVLDNPQLRISYISAIDNLFEVVISRHISCEKQMPQ